MTHLGVGLRKGMRIGCRASRRRSGRGLMFMSRTPSTAAVEAAAAGRTPGWPEIGGSGPVSGTIGITDRTAVGSLRNYSPRGGGVEFVYDPATNTFVAGRPTKGLFDGSPHEQLAHSIGVADRPLVGGTLHRGAKGEIFTTENSGHFGQNWTNANRQQFQDWLSKRLSIPVKHQPWDK